MTVIYSVGGGVSERRGGEADTGVGDVVNVIEPLEERVSIDEVEALARIRAEVRRDEIDAVGIAANLSVQLNDMNTSAPSYIYGITTRGGR